MLEMEPEELEIEAPWGKIAVKLWGNQNDQPVLTIHGIMDNAGSFDTLIPLLPKHFYICIDLPGHGKSSHFPPNLPIHPEDHIMAYTIVMQYFKKERFIIMGHSYGGQLGALYAQIYPEKVEKLIMLDTVYFVSKPMDSFKDNMEYIFDNILRHGIKQENSKQPVYTYEEAIERIMERRPSLLTEKAARILAKRMLVPSGDDKYNFSIDQRLKYMMNSFNYRKYAFEILKTFPVTCPVLIIFAKNNFFQRDLMRPFIIFYKTQNNYTIKYIPGLHDVHLTNPERVAPLVTKFMNEKQKSKL